MPQYIMGSAKESNAVQLVRGWWTSVPARRILVEGGLLLALLAVSSWLVRR
jgi:hypothetical protein